MSDRCVGVAVFVLRALEASNESEVLLLRRAGGGFEGTWCPVAGTTDAGESPEQTARRELLEETGLGAERLVPLPVRIHVSGNNESARGIIPVFVAFVSADRPVELDREHTAHRWLSFADARPLLPLEEQRVVLDEIERVVVRGETVVALSRVPWWQPLRLASWLRHPPIGTELVFYVGAPEHVRAALIEAGYEPGEVQRQSWGHRDFRITDPDGHYVRISEGGAIPEAESASAGD